MRNELSEHHLPPLSTRMIFLHHRVRQHDEARRHAVRGGGAGEAMPLAAWIGLVAFLFAAAMLFGVIHA